MSKIKELQAALVSAYKKGDFALGDRLRKELEIAQIAESEGWRQDRIALLDQIGDAMKEAKTAQEATAILMNAFTVLELTMTPIKRARGVVPTYQEILDVMDLNVEMKKKDIAEKLSAKLGRDVPPAQLQRIADLIKDKYVRKNQKDLKDKINVSYTKLHVKPYAEKKAPVNGATSGKQLSAAA